MKSCAWCLTKTAKPIMALKNSGDETTTMAIDQARHRPTGRHRRITAGADVAARSGAGEIVDLAHCHIARRGQPKHRGERLAGNDGRHVPVLGTRNSGGPVQKGFHQRIKRQDRFTILEVLDRAMTARLA